MAKRGHKHQEFVAHTSGVNCLSIGKKSCRVFITGGEDRKVNLWAFGKPTPLLSLSGSTSPIESVSFDPTEVLVLAGSFNGTIKLWDLEEAKMVRTVNGHRSSCTSVGFHPFGEFFASGSLDTDLKIWDIRKKECIHTYKGHTRGVRTIRFTPDGRWVVTGGEDNIVKLWDLTAGKLLHEFKFHNGQIRCIDFHPQEFLLATGAADRTVKFWDLETFELIGSAGPESSGIRSMIFHPDGRTLLCGLDENLKVFSWEPIICHDAVEMEWCTLADLCIYEGKLFGCSYRQSCIGVWIADITLIRPYAVGVMHKVDDLMEPIYSHDKNHSVEPFVSISKSSPLIAAEHLQCESKAEDLLKRSFMISNQCGECTPKAVESIYASSNALISSTELKSKRASVSLHSDPPKSHSKSSAGVSAINSATLTVHKTTEKSLSSSKMRRCSSLRNISLISATSRARGSLPSKKGSLTDMHTVTNSHAKYGPVSTPVIVPRDALAQTTIGKETTTTRTSHLTESCMPIHLQKPSLNDANDSSEGSMVNCGSAEEDEKDHARNISGNFERIMTLDPSLELKDDKYAETVCSSNEASPVKYVRGVAVQLGRTRSLVESWEKREKSNSGSSTIACSPSDPVSTVESSPSLSKGQDDSSARDMTRVDDDFIPGVLLQNHDVLINVIKSRLTKLQVVRHFWEQNGIKGAINAVVKLPDHSVQVDVISILIGKTRLFTLDLFTCLLPMLAGLLNSKTERHITVSLEMLLELVKAFGPVISSTLSASLVGVDLQAEQSWVTNTGWSIAGSVSTSWRR
ncbi:katanin p80 WD40 repeat-containing subunit B1 homolog KTN80.1-like isoform X2 [Dioscorea cayenensis subsp. rotundata]|uniref:Katanin p80 WD40 repeat-containing subunit B1 homolog n=1 Tax=Dioscorea cayennensis subsp. rotundata TaxID=55577 RepID=A0AB40BX82_DIOCR|nr:katanin p80 WD40 repeat-containing subunit B1 homolog KTN80.1-like isoform X2 [Dioscorea cayenensis subsp. rotundata]